ncbi:hypothetical protein BE61_28970 [Bradyrhizobium elkanii USDA 61]|nr:hypothetical protein BE61_28970 [Bradyrhizobium elkanii USDA 61]GEC53443.1 hypothetical protein BEL01nite_24860 [Bradyrhizobium elkanii]
MAAVQITVDGLHGDTPVGSAAELDRARAMCRTQALACALYTISDGDGLKPSAISCYARMQRND